MGQFSWMYADTDNKEALLEGGAAYVPLPNGETIEEHDYDGYGRFGGNDIYDLVADWNREYLAKHPEFIIPGECGGQQVRVDKHGWYKHYSDLTLSRDQVVKRSGIYEYRHIGIDIACYDDQNNALPFPIKICKYKPSPGAYNRLPISWTDPNQGWGEPDDDDDSEEE